MYYLGSKNRSCWSDCTDVQLICYFIAWYGINRFCHGVDQLNSLLAKLLHQIIYQVLKSELFFLVSFCFKVSGFLTSQYFWATSWQNHQNCICAQRRLRSAWAVWSVFAVRMKKAWVLSYPVSAQRRLLSDWADAQADLNLCWVHSHFVGFVMRWLISLWSPKMRIPEKFAVITLKFEQYGFTME